MASDYSYTFNGYYAIEYADDYIVVKAMEKYEEPGRIPDGYEYRFQRVSYLPSVEKSFKFNGHTVSAFCIPCSSIALFAYNRQVDAFYSHGGTKADLELIQTDRTAYFAKRRECNLLPPAYMPDNYFSTDNTGAQELALLDFVPTSVMEFNGDNATVYNVTSVPDKITGEEKGLSQLIAIDLLHIKRKNIRVSFCAECRHAFIANTNGIYCPDCREKGIVQRNADKRISESKALRKWTSIRASKSRQTKLQTYLPKDCYAYIERRNSLWHQYRKGLGHDITEGELYSIACRIDDIEKRFLTLLRYITPKRDYAFKTEWVLFTKAFPSGTIETAEAALAEQEHLYEEYKRSKHI